MSFENFFEKASKKIKNFKKKYKKLLTLFSEYDILIFTA